jgi:hypothetical protein
VKIEFYYAILLKSETLKYNFSKDFLKILALKMKEKTFNKEEKVFN